MIRDFEKRYNVFLEEACEESIVNAASIEKHNRYLCQEQPIISKDEVKCAEDGFIEQFCL